MLVTVLVIVIAIIVLYIILIYNKLIRLRNLTKEGWSGIDVQLKRRADLIPNLIESVKGYMGHERGIMEKVTELRTQALNSSDVSERAANENMLTSALKQLFAVSENYPDLKASQNFIDLQHTLTSIEDQIQLARRYYNGTVRDLNITIQSFPSNIIAQKFHFEQAVFFELEEPKDRAVPVVKLT